MLAGISVKNENATYHDLVHGGITVATGSSSGSGCRGGRGLVASGEVVAHLRVQLLGCLLCGPDVLAALLVGGLGRASLCGDALAYGSLASGDSGLGLDLGLAGRGISASCFA